MTGYRVPCLFYAPSIIPARRVSTVACQTDIAPTLLAMLGGSYEHGFLGRNILAVAPGDGFAMMREYKRIGAVAAERALVLMPGKKLAFFKTDGPTIKKIPIEAKKLERLKLRLLSYHALANHLYFTGSYQDPSGK